MQYKQIVCLQFIILLIIILITKKSVIYNKIAFVRIYINNLPMKF